MIPMAAGAMGGGGGGGMPSLAGGLSAAGDALVGAATNNPGLAGAGAPAGAGAGPGGGNIPEAIQSGFTQLYGGHDPTTGITWDTGRQKYSGGAGPGAGPGSEAAATNELAGAAAMGK